MGSDLLVAYVTGAGELGEGILNLTVLDAYGRKGQLYRFLLFPARDLCSFLLFVNLKHRSITIPLTSKCFCLQGSTQKPTIKSGSLCFAVLHPERIPSRQIHICVSRNLSFHT